MEEENKGATGSSMDDIVFEERNKEYGAYQIRKAFRKNFTTAMIASGVFIMLMAFSPDIYGFITKIFGKEDIVMEDLEKMDEVILEDIPLDPETPPPPALEIPPPKVEMIRFLPPEIKPDNEVKQEEIPPTQEDLEEKKNIGSENQEGDTTLNVAIDDGPKGNQIVDDAGDDQVYTAVEEDAEFPGGNEAMMKFISKNIVYPRKAEKMELEGKVVVYFEIDKEGKVTNVKLYKGFNEECDQEAIRVVKMMPQWKPAKQNGRHVRVRRTLPVRFTLPD
jgi:periplasmic protein TonB